MSHEERQSLIALFWTMVNAARPEHYLHPHLEAIASPQGRTIIIGAGKAAAEMAAFVDCYWSNRPVSGTVVVKKSEAGKVGRIRLVEGSHPNPDKSSAQAAAQLLDAVKGLSSNDLVVCLLSEGRLH